MALSKEDLQALSNLMDMKLAPITKDIASLKSNVSFLTKEVCSLRSDVDELKADVSGLKTDVAELKTDVSMLKTDVAELKTDVSMLKAGVSGLKTDVSKSLDLLIDFYGKQMEYNTWSKQRISNLDSRVVIFEEYLQGGPLHSKRFRKYK